MATTRQALKAVAAKLAQDPGDGGASLLSQYTGTTADYESAIDLALVLFQQDRPNLRIVDITVAAAAHKVVLHGTGTVLPVTGLDVWVDGGSYVTKVWHPFDDTEQGAEPMDDNAWRLQRIPGPKTILEVLDRTLAVADVVRLEYITPHTVHDATAASSSPLAADVPALGLLVAVQVLNMAATRMAQNTGNSGLPADIVDRRTQSDIAKSRAWERWQDYCRMVGRNPKGDDGPGPASAFIDLDLTTQHRRGFLWHHQSQR